MSKVSVEKILEIISEANIVEDVKELDHNQALDEQGVDSLDLSGLLFNLEEEFGITIPDADIDGIQNINAIVTYVNTKI